jgi:hypothetical protein
MDSTTYRPQARCRVSCCTALKVIELTDSEALYEEQKRMFGNSDGTFRDLEYEEVKNMPVMDSCIREALRLVCPLDIQDPNPSELTTSTPPFIQSTEK